MVVAIGPFRSVMCCVPVADPKAVYPAGTSTLASSFTLSTSVWCLFGPIRILRDQRLTFICRMTMVKLSLVDSGGSRIYDYVLVGGVAALCFYICNAVYNAFFSPISSVPGPLAARFTRLWELIAVYRGDFHKTNQKLHEQYGASHSRPPLPLMASPRADFGKTGSVVRLAPKRFSVSDPSAIRTILGHGAGFSKSAFYAPFGAPDRYNLFSEPKNAKHAAMRRRISMLYSTSALLSYEGFVDSCTSTLMSKFREFAKAGVKVPMCSFLQYYAFDVIGDITVS